MVDVETARALMDEADRLGLECAPFLRSLPEEEVAAEFNGVGPEWFPAKAREVLDRVFELFLPAVAGHDLGYRHGDGTYRDFRRVNKMLGDDCVRIAEATFSWYDPRRYAYRDRARKIETACDIFGWPTYKSACAKNKPTKEEEEEAT